MDHRGYERAIAELEERNARLHAKCGELAIALAASNEKNSRIVAILKADLGEPVETDGPYVSTFRAGYLQAIRCVEGIK